MTATYNPESEQIPTYPQINFALDEDFDIQKFSDFVFRCQSGGGHNFRKIIQQIHPELQAINLLPEKQAQEIIKQYVKNYYLKNRGELEKMSSELAIKWNGYAPYFFQTTSKLFPNTPWPKGQYQGFLSITPPYPRYLDRRIFQFPISSPEEDGIKTTAHEMLHFIFFEYVRRRYTPQLDNTDEEEMERLLENRFQIPLWELSEVFNTALLTETDFAEGGDKIPQPYPALVAHLKTVQKLWEEVNGNIDDFFIKIEIH